MRHIENGGAPGGMMKMCKIRVVGLVVAALLACGERVGAQQQSPGADSESQPAAPVATPESAHSSRQGHPLAEEHRFWDTTNDLLFAGVAASRTLDYFSTLNMRRRGRQEILITNDVVDNHAAFAVIEAAGTGVSIGASYLFHRYGHHKLERWVSVVHIGLATTGSVRNYCLKTFHTTP